MKICSKIKLRTSQVAVSVCRKFGQSWEPFAKCPWMVFSGRWWMLLPTGNGFLESVTLCSCLLFFFLLLPPPGAASACLLSMCRTSLTRWPYLSLSAGSNSYHHIWMDAGKFWNAQAVDVSDACSCLYERDGWFGDVLCCAGSDCTTRPGRGGMIHPKKAISGTGQVLVSIRYIAFFLLACGLASYKTNA